VIHPSEENSGCSLEIQSLGKRFGSQLVLDDVSLSVGRGEFFSLIGSSGCGKTTLLRCLAGFVTPDRGTIHIDGNDILPLPPNRRPVNMVFQSYALFPHMSVEDNIAFGLRREGLPRDVIRRRVGEALDLIRMQNLRRRRPSQLSGGQKQRVALARAVVKRPRLLLLDEPLSALDKKLRESTRLELVEIQQQIGITFILVTHDQEEALTMSSRIGVMSDGKLLQVGTPSDIYERPQSRFVADFIGSVTLFDGVVDHILPGSVRLDCETLSAVVATGGPKVAKGEKMTLAVRPEAIAIAAADQNFAFENRFIGTVISRSYGGDRRLYQVRLPGGRLVLVSETNLGDQTPVFQRDQIVAVGWPAAAGALFRP